MLLFVWRNSMNDYYEDFEDDEPEDEDEVEDEYDYRLDPEWGAYDKQD